MNFERKSKRDERRRNADVDRLAHKEQRAKLQGKVKKLRSEVLQFLVCCLIGGALGVVAYFAI